MLAALIACGPFNGDPLNVCGLRVPFEWEDVMEMAAKLAHVANTGASYLIESWAVTDEMVWVLVPFNLT